MRPAEQRRPLATRLGPTIAGFARACVGLAASSLLLAFCLSTPAQAQMVPRGAHILSQGGTGDGITTARLPWPGRLNSGPMAERGMAGAGGNGLALRDNGPWPNWEGRIGAVIDRPVNPLRDSFVLAQPVEGGLRVRSLHLLADHYVEGGFRATVGLVSGEAGQAWWSSGDHGGGLNLSLQQLDTLGSPLGLGRRNLLPQAQAYVGAGYSARSNALGLGSNWRFNADFGLLNTDPDGIDRFTGVLQGDRSFGDMVRGLRMRPVVKVSLGYAF
jgi:hypothetical protein